MGLFHFLFGRRKPVTSKPEPRLCPQCKVACRDGGQFCHACGHLADLYLICNVLPNGGREVLLPNGNLVTLGPDGRRAPQTCRDEWWQAIDREALLRRSDLPLRPITYNISARDLCSEQFRQIERDLKRPSHRQGAYIYGLNPMDSMGRF